MCHYVRIFWHIHPPILRIYFIYRKIRSGGEEIDQLWTAVSDVEKEEYFLIPPWENGFCPKHLLRDEGWKERFDKHHWPALYVAGMRSLWHNEIRSETKVKLHCVLWISQIKGGGIVISYEPLFRTMKEKGITSYRLFKMGFPQSNYYAMKHGENVSTNTINELCILLECEISDVMEFLPEQRK